VVLFEGEGTFIVVPEGYETFYYPGMEVENNGGVKRLTFTIPQAAQDAGDIGFFMLSQGRDYVRNIRILTPGGVCGRTVTELNRFQFCQTPRGGSGQCMVGEQCFDFEQTHFNRFTDPVSEMNNKVVFHPE